MKSAEISAVLATIAVAVGWLKDGRPKIFEMTTSSAYGVVLGIIVIALQ